MVSRDEVFELLANFTDPVSGENLISANLIKGLSISSTEIKFLIELKENHGKAHDVLRGQVQSTLEEKYPDNKITVILTAHRQVSKNTDSLSPNKIKIGRHPSKQNSKLKPPGIKNIVLVGSGKGGVGKSTVSANLAIALSKLGLSVGLMDADIYGPSQPKIMGVSGKPKMGGEGGKLIIPLKGYGITLMSMGFLVPQNEAVVWRGPMLMGALEQFVNQVDWGNLDILLIDLPPGTGDVQLSLAQKCDLKGAIIVSTPQDIALLDARKAIHMFYKLDVPIIGIIENMAGYICKNCGHEEPIFGIDGAKKESEKVGFDYLGKIQLDLDLRKSADEGKPLVVEKFDSPITQTFLSLANSLRSRLDL